MANKALHLQQAMENYRNRTKVLAITSGKGGVGKTSLAVSLATRLAVEGHRVHLTTTDPAAHIEQALGQPVKELRVSRIDDKGLVQRTNLVSEPLPQVDTPTRLTRTLRGIAPLVPKMPGALALDDLSLGDEGRGAYFYACCFGF